MSVQKQRNCSIDFFRLVCAIMVVAIHTHPFEDINPTLGFIFSKLLPNIAVPFFFVVSGYFYFCKIDKPKALWTFVKNIIIVYTIWSIFYIAINSIFFGISSIKALIVDSLMNYFIYGTGYHLWFIPALIYSAVISTLIYKIKTLRIILIPISFALYFLGVFGTSYYSFCLAIPIISSIVNYSHFTEIRRILCMGFPLFVAGYVVKLILVKFKNRKTRLIFLISSILLYIVEIILVCGFHLSSETTLSVGVYLVTISIVIALLNNPLEKFSLVSAKCRCIANLVYYIHPAILILLSRFFKMETYSTITFLVVVAISIMIGLLFSLFSNRKIVKIILG